MRPITLNKELIKEICGWVENGNTFKDACILSNIGKSIFYEWKKKGIEDIEKGNKTIQAELVESIKKAKIKFKAYRIKKIMNAAEKERHWTASAWLLQHIFREEFGDKIEVTAKVKIKEEKRKKLDEIFNMDSEKIDE